MRLITLTTIAAALAAGTVLTSTRSAWGDQYARRDGKQFDAAVVEATAERVKFKLRSGKEQVLQAEELAPQSHYAALVAHLSPGTPVQRLALARTCLQAKLFGPARAESKRAALDDAAVAVDAGAISAAADEGEAGELLARGLEQMAAGDEAGTRLLLRVLNRFPHSGALPAAAAGLRQWTDGVLPVVAPKAGAAAKKRGASRGPFGGVDAAIDRAATARTSGLKTTVTRGDKRLRFFRAAETELEAARRWVVALKRAGRAPAADCDAKLLELKAAFLKLAVAAGGALLDSRRPSDARRFIYQGLSVEPSHPPLLDLQARLAAALLNDPDASGMTLEELSRRIARGTATHEMIRLYARRLAQREAAAGATPAPGGTPTPVPVVPGRQGEADPAPVPPPPGPTPSPQRPNGG
ncbi:MAG: hypothetical protein ACYTGX_10840 [Planctomycetota bacterium]|jgi:hypothetical protein